MEKITGKNNDLIKGVKKLLSSSKERKSQAVFVLEGARLVFDVLHSFCEVKTFLITSQAYEKYKKSADSLIERSEKSYIITDEISDKLSDTQNSQGVFAVCKMPVVDAGQIKADGRYIALDNIQDPGNLGAIVRTAEALGIDGIFVGGGCDIYNPKALRASMGSMLRMKICNTDHFSAYLENLKKLGLSVYGTVPDSRADKITDIDFSKGGVCVIGNEANGISDAVKNICTRLITIPMQGRAESLNASVAASITMWEMLR